MATRRTAAAAVGTVATNYPILKDKAVVTAAEEYATNKAEIDRLEALNKEHRKTIEAALAGAPIAYAGARIIRCTEVKALPATPNTVITKAMVGQVIPGKKGKAGYTRLEVA